MGARPVSHSSCQRRGLVAWTREDCLRQAAFKLGAPGWTCVLLRNIDYLGHSQFAPRKHVTQLLRLEVAWEMVRLECRWTIYCRNGRPLCMRARSLRSLAPVGNRDNLAKRSAEFCRVFCQERECPRGSRSLLRTATGGMDATGIFLLHSMPFWRQRKQISLLVSLEHTFVLYTASCLVEALPLPSNCQLLLVLAERYLLR